MTPTRDEFQAVADWLGIKLNWSGYATIGLPIRDDAEPNFWQPHLPGIDNQRLLGVLFADVYWLPISSAVDVTIRMPGTSVFEVAVDHDNTIEGKLTALASAIWQCAVRVAQEAKRRPDCECSAAGPVCTEYSPTDTSEILPRCECGHHKECHKEEA